jgi:pimeloyl-ACP methyl ester carboxylesterase
MRYLHVPASEPPAQLLPALVLVHGLMGYSFSWRFNLEELARHRDVYAVDLLGIGHSDRPRPGAADYSIPAAAERLLGLIRSLGHRRVDLLGTSHGGAVSMLAAALDAASPEPVLHKLVLVAPAHPFMVNARLRIAFFRTPVGRLFSRIFLRRSATLGILAIGRLYADESRVTEETRIGYGVNLTEGSSYDYALEVLRTWKEDMHQLRSALSKITHLPALLLWGEEDRAVACRSGLMLRGSFRNAQYVVLPGVGHMTYEEVPEVFNRTVLQFLDS